MGVVLAQHRVLKIAVTRAKDAGRTGESQDKKRANGPLDSQAR